VAYFFYFFTVKLKNFTKWQIQDRIPEAVPIRDKAPGLIQERLRRRNAVQDGLLQAAETAQNLLPAPVRASRESGLMSDF
jgi:hypothetical protein